MNTMCSYFRQNSYLDTLDNIASYLHRTFALTGNKDLARSYNELAEILNPEFNKQGMYMPKVLEI